MPPLATYWNYLGCVLVSVLLYRASPPWLRQPLILAASIFFAWVFLSPLVVAALALHVAAMYLMLRLLPASPLRLAAFVAWMVGYNMVVPHRVLHLELALAGPLGPDYFLCAILVKMAWRSVFVYYEVASRTVERVALGPLATYMAGLPFLGGQSIALSYRHFVSSTAASTADLSAAQARGGVTLAACLAIFMAWQTVSQLPLFAVFPAPPGAGLDSMLWITVVWFVGYCVKRYAFEQGAVGVCRLFGYNVRDNYAPTVLLSRNHLEFWRGWNALWREFLVAWIYYPLLLRLGRRFDVRHPAVIALAGFATCFGDVLFDFFPFALFFLPDIGWTAWTFWSVIWDHVAWGLLVGVNLYMYVARPPWPRWPAPVKIAFTLGSIILLQVFKKNPMLGFDLWSAVP